MGILFRAVGAAHHTHLNFDCVHHGHRAYSRHVHDAPQDICKNRARNHQLPIHDSVHCAFWFFGNLQIQEIHVDDRGENSEV